jgi:hypothetical protein
LTRTVNLPETVYEGLVSISEELTSIARKPISLSMTVHLLNVVYRAYMDNPCTRDAFRQQLASLKVMSPEEFDKVWDEVEPEKNE